MIIAQYIAKFQIGLEKAGISALALKFNVAS